MMFSKFSKIMGAFLGNVFTFIIAVILVLIWLLTGHFFNYSDTWQLLINTSTTIITFLMIFILQNTQNRDTLAIQLKLDEIIRATSHAHNEMLKVEELSDEELKKLLARYENLAAKVKEKIEQGGSDEGTPEL